LHILAYSKHAGSQFGIINVIKVEQPLLGNQCTFNADI